MVRGVAGGRAERGPRQVRTAASRAVPSATPSRSPRGIPTDKRGRMAHEIANSATIGR